MKAFIWKVRAYMHMRKLAGFSRWEMVESLYESYGDYSPIEAVEEDLSYWQ